MQCPVCGEETYNQAHLDKTDCLISALKTLRAQRQFIDERSGIMLTVIGEAIETSRQALELIELVKNRDGVQPAAGPQSSGQPRTH